jgi:hypothetical protein
MAPFGSRESCAADAGLVEREKMSEVATRLGHVSGYSGGANGWVTAVYSGYCHRGGGRPSVDFAGTCVCRSHSCASADRGCRVARARYRRRGLWHHLADAKAAQPTPDSLKRAQRR